MRHTFPTGEKVESDHRNRMGGGDLTRRIEECYLPNKIVLIVDDLPKRYGTAQDWRGPLQATKTGNLETVRPLGVSLITVERVGKQVTWNVLAPRGPHIDK